MASDAGKIVDVTGKQLRHWEWFLQNGGSANPECYKYFLEVLGLPHTKLLQQNAFALRQCAKRGYWDSLRYLLTQSITRKDLIQENNVIASRAIYDGQFDVLKTLKKLGLHASDFTAYRGEFEKRDYTQIRDEPHFAQVKRCVQNNYNQTYKFLTQFQVYASQPIPTLELNKTDRGEPANAIQVASLLQKAIEDRDVVKIMELRRKFDCPFPDSVYKVLGRKCDNEFLNDILNHGPTPNRYFSEAIHTALDCDNVEFFQILYTRNFDLNLKYGVTCEWARGLGTGTLLGDAFDARAAHVFDFLWDIGLRDTGRTRDLEGRLLRGLEILKKYPSLVDKKRREEVIKDRVNDPAYLPLIRVLIKDRYNLQDLRGLKLKYSIDPDYAFLEVLPVGKSIRIKYLDLYPRDVLVCDMDGVKWILPSYASNSVAESYYGLREPYLNRGETLTLSEPFN